MNGNDPGKVEIYTTNPLSFQSYCFEGDLYNTVINQIGFTWNTYPKYITNWQQEKMRGEENTDSNPKVHLQGKSLLIIVCKAEINPTQLTG